MDLRRGQPLARDAMAYVLAGGRGSRLMEMTDTRAKPAVYFGGKARIIDFALYNAINSGIRRIGVAAGTSCATNVTRASTSSPPASGSANSNGMKAPPMRSFRILTSSRAMRPNSWSSWQATMSIRWTMN